MSSICNFVSTAIYNRFSQSPAIQKLAAGVGCLSQGKHLLCDPDSSPAPSLIRKIGRKAAGVALLAGGLAGLYYGGQTLATASIDNLKSAFLFGQSPIASMQKEDSMNEPSTEILYLVASADSDPGGALNPSIPNFIPDRLEERIRLGYDALPSCLNAITKLEYKVIQHPLQICEKIRSTAKKASVQELIIAAHGTSEEIAFSRMVNFKIFDLLPSNCFDGLSSKARIFLQSCSTGKNMEWLPNIAEWISWISGREVVAPSEDVDGTLGQCSLNQEGRLDIKLVGVKREVERIIYDSSTVIFRDKPAVAVDYTQHFNTTASWSAKAFFSMKLVIPTVLGTMATWQTMRFGATVLQGSGAAAEWLVDRSAAPTKRLAERVGLYNPDAAQILYATTKGTSQILNATGKAAHQAMDKLIQPVSNLGSWVFGKSINGATAVAQTLYSKMRRS